MDCSLGRFKAIMEALMQQIYLAAHVVNIRKQTDTRSLESEPPPQKKYCILRWNFPLKHQTAMSVSAVLPLATLRGTVNLLSD